MVGYGGIKNQKIDLVNMESGGSTGSNTADRKKTIRLITDYTLCGISDIDWSPVSCQPR